MKRVSSYPLILSLLLMATQLSGCNLSEEADDASTESRVERAVEEARLLGDLRLFATTGRRATLPGIAQEEVEQAKALCGVQYMAGTGDLISTTEQREKRKQLIDFMTAYNRVIFEICKKKQAD
ncbi:hypothetical protein [uncultured Shewanella sp.]|uniref:hypothetical protein n=1 Tax=Shewanella atlantica TaxID=271099 RepID=UPI0026065F71|nr:hypothetical protein [uncultured Shewanella sp.]